MTHFTAQCSRLTHEECWGTLLEQRAISLNEMIPKIQDKEIISGLIMFCLEHN